MVHGNCNMLRDVYVQLFSGGSSEYSGLLTAIVLLTLLLDYCHGPDGYRVLSHLTTWTCYQQNGVLFYHYCTASRDWKLDCKSLVSPSPRA